uniref:Neurturin n=1 Tax=Paramormyrops kingsleyae TaxID=1676925 RepID=A0A3B3R1K0_9TELE|nr:neurturin [Paramormyrops kingsleyae]
MRLWACAAIAFMFCGTALFDIFTRTTIPTGPKHLHSRAVHSPQRQPSPSIFRAAGHQRSRRATDDLESILVEFSSMFQSFTQGELQQVIGTLADRRAVQVGPQGRRTKRARKGLKPCSLREAVVSVSELGLGYNSDETLLFRYCSGRCFTHRRNYDVSLEHMKRTGALGLGRQDRARHSPCCRPTTYEDDVSFLDNNNKYYTIHQVSARECGCV